MRISGLVMGVLLGVGAVCLTGGQASAERTPLGTSLSAKGYEKIATKNGVAVWKHRRSKLIRLGAEGEIGVPPEKIYKALLDYPNQMGYIPRLSEVKVLKRTPTWLVVYQRLNLPVIDDRDFTLLVRYGKDGETYFIEYQAISNRGPGKRKGIVRVPMHRGSWQLQPIDGGRRSRVRYQMVIDLGGWVPMWMARRGSAKELPALFGHVARMAARY